MNSWAAQLTNLDCTAHADSGEAGGETSLGPAGE
jgi:hypothetical protein